MVHSLLLHGRMDFCGMPIKQNLESFSYKIYTDTLYDSIRNKNHDKIRLEWIGFECKYQV